MDHWGDPWADHDDTNDADTAKTPPKPEVAPTATPHARSTSVVIDGFLDDAQWGSVAQEEEWGGGWAAESKRGDTEAPAAEAESTTRPTPTEIGTGGWEELPEPENGVSDASTASDSGSTVQDDDEHPGRSTADPEDDASTLSSTSPSNASHSEPPAESPRTSTEDEQLAGKAVGAVEVSASESEDQDEHEDSDEVEDPGDNAASDSTVTEALHKDEMRLQEPVESPPEKPHEPSTHFPTAGAIDQTLLEQLFPPSQPSEEPEQAPDDPIHSTAARKAWYRLTRKQTMREFNSGGNDNNYVRVTWPNSHVRLHVGKIVSRWATEDRMSERGASGRASFYWGQPAKLEAKNPSAHLRTASAVPISTTVKPLDQRRPSLATDVPATFNWNSPSVAHDDPWHSETLTSRSVSPPVAKQATHTSAMLPQQSRPVSVDLAPRGAFQHEHRKTGSLISPPLSSPPLNMEPVGPVSIDTALTPSVVADLPRALSPLDTTSHILAPDTTKEEDDDDDDDEWGEMIQSPVLSAPVDSFTESPGTLAIFPPPSAWAKSSPFDAPASRDALPIVRLQGTVASTSALLRVDKYVPPSVEQGPIGPGILRKKSSQSVVSTPERPHVTSTPMAMVGDEFYDQVEESPPKSDQSDAVLQTAAGPDKANGYSTSDSPPRNASPATEADNTDEPAPHLNSSDSTNDPWTDADFSIFESAAPLAHHSTPKQTPEILSSFTTSPATSSPFVNLPPTSVTHSAESRKAAEDEIISGILDSLPDLKYMLRP